MAKLATPNQISIWLENDSGFSKYTKLYPNNPGYFLHFTSVDPADEAYGELDEGLDSLQARILGQVPKEKYGFAITQKVSGGIAGAAYLYAEPSVQRDIATVEKNILDVATSWAASHNAKITSTEYPTSGDKFMVITILLNPPTS